MRDPEGAEGAAELISRYLLYGAHPFVVDSIGTEYTLAEITTDAVRQAYKDYITPQNTVLAVAGRCALASVQGQARAVFGLWSGKARPTRLYQSIPSLTASRLELRELPVHNCCVMLTFPVCGAKEADYLPLRLVDTLLSGGTSARLFQKIREEKHLAYEVSTIFPPQVTGTGFSMYAITRSGVLEKTKAALVAELGRLQADTVPAVEVQRAKALMKGRYLLSHQYSAQYAFDLAWYEMSGLGVDYDRRLAQAIDAITPADIQRVSRTYFTHYYLVVIIPQIDPSGFSLIPEEEGPDS
jgi:predicted Zn-dependent peptidase